MRFSICLSVALLLFPFAQAREKKEPNPKLVNIHKLFIKGNNEAATDARKRVLIPRDQVTRVSCIGLVGKEAVADGTLELSQETAPDGTITVSGTLMDREGNLLWNDSKPGHGIDLVSPPLSAAQVATDSLMYGFEDEMCGVPPLIELSKVRKIHVADRQEAFKNVIWESGCLTFVENYVDADAVFTLTGSITRKGKAVWVLFDPKNNDKIPGWETDSGSFRGVADLERAVGCR